MTISKLQYVLLACALALTGWPPLSTGTARADDDHYERYERREKKLKKKRYRAPRKQVKRRSKANPPANSRKRLMEDLRSRKILPLEKILKIFRERFNGEIIETEFEYEHGLPVYEIKYITPDGHVYEVYINARNGTVAKMEREDD